MNYYDGVLAGIGILMAGGTGLSIALGPAAIFAVAIVAIALVGHAMFFNPPTGSTENEQYRYPRRTPEQALGRDASDSSLPQAAPQLDD